MQLQKPAKIEIKVGRKFTWLHVLHSTAYAVNEGPIQIAAYTLHYEDGTTATIPIVNGKDISAFWKRPGDQDPSVARVGWEGSNEHVKQKGFKIRLYVSSWENPRPDATVARIEFVSAMTKAAPFCVAMTLANPLKPRPPDEPITAADLDRNWTQLASEGPTACDAVEALAGVPTRSVAFLASRFKPTAPIADAKRIAGLIVKLDDENFYEREKATVELQKVGFDALGQLRQASVETKSAEVRERVKELLEKLKSHKLTQDEKRLQATLCVLEVISSEEARKVLEELAGGKAGGWLAAEAEASLKRIQKMERPKKGM
jgi:hypothetical protein